MRLRRLIGQWAMLLIANLVFDMLWAILILLFRLLAISLSLSCYHLFPITMLPVPMLKDALFWVCMAEASLVLTMKIMAP